MSCVHGWLLCQSTATTTKVFMKAQMEIVQLRKENQTLKTENNSLRSKVADLEAMVHRLGQIIREKLPEVYAAITQPKRDRQQPPQKQKPKSRDLER